MSKPIKNLIKAQYQDRFGDVDSAVLIDIRGVASNDNNKLRADLSKKKIRVTVVQNNLAKSAFKGTKLENMATLLEGPSALVYGGSSVVEVAREMIAIVKEIKTVQFKGAVMEGAIFTADQLEELSKYPTRGEAQAQVVQLILSPAKNVVGAILGPGRKIASLVKAIEEKLEKSGAAGATTEAAAAGAAPAQA